MLMIVKISFYLNTLQEFVVFTNKSYVPEPWCRIRTDQGFWINLPSYLVWLALLQAERK